MNKARKEIISIIGDYMDKTVEVSSLLVIEILKDSKFNYGEENHIGFLYDLKDEDKNEIIGSIEDNGKEYYSGRDYSYHTHPVFFDKYGVMREIASLCNNSDLINDFIFYKYEKLINKYNDYIFAYDEIFKNKEKLLNEIHKITKINKEDILEGIDVLEYEYLMPCKILGHYDITALQKFLYKNFSGEIDFDLDYIYLYPSQTLSLSLNKEELKIPHKSLHLYTEQQEKDLLELLKKLGKQ